MSIEKVRAYFADFGIAGRILEFPVSSATVELAIPELEQYSGYVDWVDVCKAWRTQEA